jgi:hypothetical protein
MEYPVVNELKKIEACDKAIVYYISLPNFVAFLRIINRVFINYINPYCDGLNPE